MQAVVGAGPAGLVAARELQREGHAVHVFEQMHDVGGVWLPDENVESDMLGQDHSRTRVHTSMYHSLRTNLPRELMGLSDFPFLPRYMKVSFRTHVPSGELPSCPLRRECNAMNPITNVPGYVCHG